MHEKYDNIETEFKLLVKGVSVNLVVRPYKTDSTKVTMSVTGSKVRKETVIEAKNYRGTLQAEPAPFKFE